MTFDPLLKVLLVIFRLGTGRHSIRLEKMILDGKFQILGIKTTVGHYIITFSRNSSCLIGGGGGWDGEGKEFSPIHHKYVLTLSNIRIRLLSTIYFGKSPGKVNCQRIKVIHPPLTIYQYPLILPINCCHSVAHLSISGRWPHTCR